MICEYASNYYGVPACIGRLVTFNGRSGIIAEDRGHYIGVNFDDQKPGQISNVHPTDLEYGEMGIVRKMSRSQQRYRDFVRMELDVSFGEYLSKK